MLIVAAWLFLGQLSYNVAVDDLYIYSLLKYIISQFMKSCTNISPETAQKPCKTDARILHHTNCHHEDNRFGACESSPLSFLGKCRVYTESSVMV